eukprot:5764727-Alexandrium_andersonii.AAC.1
MDLVECQSTVGRVSAGPLMRIQVSAGSCAVAASPAPFRWTNPPREEERVTLEERGQQGTR